MKFAKKHIKLISTVLIIILIIVGILIKYKLIKENSQNEEEIIKEETIDIVKTEEKEEPITQVYVDIKGAVQKPGVYEINEKAKVIDVINIAGGFTDNADTSMINLAKKVKNEMVIIIYTKEEVKEATKPNQIIKYVDKECICPQIKNDACLKTETNNNQTETKENETNTNEKVNINTATLEELLTITGIGESKAKSIIEYRNEKGPFQSIEQIKEVNGIGESLYEKIKDSITI